VRKKLRCNNVVVDGSVDNAEHDVVDELDRVSRSVNKGFGTIGVVDAEALGIPNTIMINGIPEDDKIEEETADVVEVVEVAGDERVVAIIDVVVNAGEDEDVAKFHTIDDDGVLEIVVAAELVDEDEIVEASDEVVAGEVE
jgi:hypothetical protein